MNLLEIVQTFCARSGLRRPTQVATSTDQTYLQIMALANEICEDLVDRWTFEALIKETVFTSVAGQDQGPISTIAPNGFLRILEETIYDRTQKVPIYGPIGPAAWQQSQAFMPTGPLYRYRLRGGHLLFDPVADPGHTDAFEYASSWIVENVSDGVQKPYFTKDSDTFLLDDKLLISGLRWKWKAEKNLPYAEEFKVYEDAATTAAGRSGSKPILRMDGTMNEANPMIIISPGSWPLP